MPIRAWSLKKGEAKKLDEINEEDEFIIDVENPNENEVKEICEKFFIEKDEILDCLDENEIPRIKKEGYIQMIVGIVTEDLERTTIGIFNFKNKVILIHKRKLKFVENAIRESFGKDLKFFLKTLFSEYLSHLTKLLSEIKRHYERIEKMIYTFEEREKIVYEIWDVRDDLYLFLKTVQEDQIIFQEISKELKDEDLLEDYQQTVSTVKFYLDSTKSAFDSLVSLISLDLNKRVERLTIITLVLSIPTMVASIYGMNFKYIPLYYHPFGFWIITFFSILLGILSYFFFIKQ